MIFLGQIIIEYSFIKVTPPKS